MKTIKKAIFALGVLATTAVSAQSSDMKNMFKIGVEGGVSTTENASGNIGVNVSYQHLVTPGFGLGLATGYNHFFGKDYTMYGVNVQNNDFGVVPLAALVRFYPAKTGFYAGADLGYGFIVGNDKVTNNNLYNADMPNGGFYIKPEIGWHNRDWNVYAHYTTVLTGDEGTVAGNQKFGVGSVGVGVGYNIPLGN